jgi:hypothetical protein
MLRLTRTKLSQTRLQNGAIDFLPGGVWRLWLHTADWEYGTMLLLYSDGRIERVTTYRDDTPDDIVCIAPTYKKDEEQ